MFRSLLCVSVLFCLNAPASAGSNADTSLLQLCDAFGETTKECTCYLGEIKTIYTANDIELAGGVARAFLNGEEPEAIAAYLLMTRKMTLTRANQLYQLGDAHTKRIGQKCEDKTQKLTPAAKAKREHMESRIENIGARYRVGPSR